MRKVTTLSGIEYFEIDGYSQDSLIQLIKEIEILNDNEEPIVFTDEHLFIKFFNSNNIFYSKFLRFGYHFVIPNNKKINRYRERLNFDDNTPLIVVVSNDCNYFGIIKA